MLGNNDLVASYGAHVAAEDAVRTLGRAGYDIRTLSILVSDYRCEERVVGFYDARDRMRHWSVCGLFLGGVFGALLSGTFYLIPGSAPALAKLGDLLTVAIGGAVGGAALIGGLGAFLAGAYSMVAPKDCVLKYDLQIGKTDEFLLVARDPAEAVRARLLLDAEAALASEAVFEHGL